MDCGAMAHKWTETQFELWVADSAEEAESRGHMQASTFLRIVARVQKEVALDENGEARIFASFGQFPASLYTIAGVSVENNQLVVELSPDRTRCRARERREAAEVAAPSASECGCGSKIEKRADVTCCG
jgi:hypothetical protein